MTDATEEQITLAILGNKIDNLSTMIERNIVTNDKQHASIEDGINVLKERVRKNENSITEIKTKQNYINYAQAVWAPVASVIAAIFGGRV